MLDPPVCAESLQALDLPERWIKPPEGLAKSSDIDGYGLIIHIGADQVRECCSIDAAALCSNQRISQYKLRGR